MTTIVLMTSTYYMERFFLVVLWYLIVHLRPDITDLENRVRSVPSRKLMAEYDYVIIGGGSAGSVLASRLSEDENCTVLLLEAGNDQIVLADVPFVYPQLQHTSLDWQFKTEPSTNYCLSMRNRQCNVPRGKVLGGTSVLNAMLYVRGNRRDYDSWAALGNTGWDYESVLPYFKKSEDARAEDLADSPYHQRDGYLTVERYKYTPPVVDYIVNAVKELGYDVHDINGEKQTGCAYSHGTLRDGLRCSTAKAFLRPASKRKNLHIKLESFVEKILIREGSEDKASKAAYGVRFRKGKRHFVARARREVILSAGSIQSPQLLMLSGIGSRDHLEEMEIPVLHDAPGVGKNLQDHVAVSLLFVVNPPANITDPNSFTVRFKSISMQTLRELVWNNTGVLYTITVGAGMAFVNTKYADETIDYPDIQLLFSGTSSTFDYGVAMSRIEDINLNIINYLQNHIAQEHTFEIYSTLLRPRSKGHVKLKSANPEDPPKIVPNYFDDPHDMEVLGVRIIQKISNTSVMRELKARLNPNLLPECQQYDRQSDEYWACYIRHLTTTIYHPVGTCKMGPANDSLAVVDERLKIHGIARLRVVDASVMPNIVSGNTNVPTIMIAEKAADMIKEEWQEKA